MSAARLPLSNVPFYTGFHSSLRGGSKRYYSSLDAEIYFGDIYIDEIVHIEYAVQQNAMPLFGYNSYIYDQVALGNRLISGAFAINFTEPGFLFSILDELSKREIRSSSMTVDKVNEGILLDNTSSGSAILAGERKPLWPYSFDIDVVFGEKNKGLLSYKDQKDVILEGVHILSCTQQLDINGEPIFDNYTFIARDIKTLAAR